MLTTSAFNALLKTLEEPPEHVLFILATTELHKLPTTIISRCQRFDFRRIGITDITKRLRYIAKCENIVLEDAAAERIAKMAEGGMRDAVSLFELCAGGGAEVTEEHAREVLGVSGYSVACDVANAVARKDMKTLFGIVAKISETKDIAVFWQEIEAEMLSAVCARFSLGGLVHQSGILDDSMRVMVRSPQTKRVTAELAFVKMCNPAADFSPEALMARVAELEDKVKLMSAGVMPVQEKKEIVAEEKPEIARTVSVPAAAVDEAASESPVQIPVKNAEDDYIPVPDMSGVVEKLSQTNPMAVEFLRSSRTEITTDGKKVRIIPDNDFACRILSGDDVIRTVSEAFLLMEISDVLPSVTVEKAEQKKKNKPSDDLFGV